MDIFFKNIKDIVRMTKKMFFLDLFAEVLATGALMCTSWM